MNYQRFKQIVRAICAKTGGGIRLKFRNDGGLFVAEYDDVTITANSKSSSLTVNYGSGHGTKRTHTSMVKVASLV